MKKRYYPYIYGGIAGVMTFIAMFYICRHSFALTNTQSLVWGIIGAILVFVELVLHRIRDCRNPADL